MCDVISGDKRTHKLVDRETSAAAAQLLDALTPVPLVRASVILYASEPVRQSKTSMRAWPIVFEVSTGMCEFIVLEPSSDESLTATVDGVFL